jgi:hypothetical protein
MADGAPMPVHLTKVLDGLAENPALPAGLVRRLVRYRHGFGHVAKRADLPAEAIEEILASGHHWLLHSLALNPPAAARRPDAAGRPRRSHHPSRPGRAHPGRIP